jgi:methylmalonyl-CoA mutase N-terminal domain/subunit
MDAERIAEGRRRWQQRYDASRRREADFTTLSGTEVAPVYGPPEGYDDPRMERIGWPGEFPFTRGLYATATAAGPGRSASSPASGTPSRPMSGTR